MHKYGKNEVRKLDQSKVEDWLWVDELIREIRKKYVRQLIVEGYGSNIGKFVAEKYGAEVKRRRG